MQRAFPLDELPAGATSGASKQVRTRLVQWIGDGLPHRTRVFVEVSKRVEVTEHKAEGRLTYRMKGVNVPVRTNQFPLVTAYFATPVERIHLFEAGPDADLVIELKHPTATEWRVLDTPRGMVLQVDFARGPGDRVVPDAEPRPVTPPPARRTVDTTRIPGSDSVY